MLRKASLVVLLLAAGSLGAQTANVIELTSVDTVRAQKAWDALQKAKNEWATLQGEVQVRYLTLPGCGPKVSMCTAATVPGFENGFEFSKDFKAIVPKPSTSGVIISPTYNWGCSTIVPTPGIIFDSPTSTYEFGPKP